MAKKIHPSITAAKKIHPSITAAKAEELLRESMFGMLDIGMCTECGAERPQTESDATDYPCEECGKNAVQGSEILFYLVS